MSDSRRGSGWADAAGSSGNSSSNSRRYGSNLPRSRSHNRASGQPALFESLLEFDIEAERAVLIGQGYNGHVAIHVVLHLNHLLLRGSHIGDVRDGQVARHLLFDGDARGGCLAGSGSAERTKARINAEPGDAEEALEPSADLT